MSGQQAVEKAIELYNQLVAVSPEDQSAIKTIEWRLRLLERQPGQLSARVASILANRLLGEIGEAIRQVEEVWGRRQMLDQQAAEAFACQLSSLGLHQRFLNYDGDRLFVGDPDRRTALQRLAYWGTADLDSLRANTSGQGWERFFNSRGLVTARPHFGAHQRIVASHTFGWQVGTALILLEDTDDDGGDWDTPVSFVFGPNSYRERCDLSDRIHRDLVAYYDACGLSDSDLSTRFAPVLLPHTSMPALIGQAATA